jgi:hypothetical protein
MTPLPTPDEMAARHTFDPAPGTVHVRDLVAMAKDGIYAKDKLSDHVIGMLLLGKSTGAVSTWEGTLFQLPFVKTMKIRSGTQHLGHAFTDPDGDVLILGGRTLHGSSDVDIQLSTFTADSLKGHPQYLTWLKDTLYAGRAADATTYVRVRNNDTLKACDNYINSVPYTPGPMSVPPATGHPSGSGSAPTSAKKKKKASTAKKTPAPAATAGPSTPKPASKKRITLKNSATEPWVMNKATAKAAKAAAAGAAWRRTQNDEGTANADPSENEPLVISDSPTSDDESSSHPQYGGKSVSSFSDFMANTSQFMVAGDGDEKPAGEESAGEESAGEQPAGEESAGEEPAAEESAGEEPAAEESAGEQPAGEKPAGEEPAAEEFAAEEPLPTAANQASDGDYDPTPTKKRKTGKGSGRKGKGKGKGGKK